MGTFKDLTGQKFGHLTVIKRISNQGTRVCFECLCDCGNRFTVQAGNLRNGRTTRCHQCTNKAKQSSKIAPGDRIGYVTIIKQVPRPVDATTGYSKYYLCKCQCGEECVYGYQQLVYAKKNGEALTHDGSYTGCCETNVRAVKFMIQNHTVVIPKSVCKRYEDMFSRPVTNELVELVNDVCDFDKDDDQMLSAKMTMSILLAIKIKENA